MTSPGGSHPRVDEEAVVVTSISEPTAALRALAAGCRRSGRRMIVVGDERTPSGMDSLDAEFWSLSRQQKLGLRFARSCPTGTYARKNIGYLLAIRAGSRVIRETDDDNHPRTAYWRPASRSRRVHTTSVPGWANVYSYFSSTPRLWPRGFPLDELAGVQEGRWARLASKAVDAPIQQSLVDGDPDVDAVSRLVFPSRRVRFRAGEIALDRGVWCPLNSQNTSWWESAFALLYLPVTCSFRLTDIWRGYIAQRLAWAAGWRVIFRGPTMRQTRNPHDLLLDLEQEVPAYLGAGRFCRVLEELKTAAGPASLEGNLRLAYRALIEARFFEPEELPLLDAWLGDLRELQGAGGSVRADGSFEAR